MSGTYIFTPAYTDGRESESEESILLSPQFDIISSACEKFEQHTLDLTELAQAVKQVLSELDNQISIKLTEINEKTGEEETHAATLAMGINAKLIEKLLNIINQILFPDYTSDTYKEFIQDVEKRNLKIINRDACRLERIDDKISPTLDKIISALNKCLLAYPTNPEVDDEAYIAVSNAFQLPEIVSKYLSLYIALQWKQNPWIKSMNNIIKLMSAVENVIVDIQLGTERNDLLYVLGHEDRNKKISMLIYKLMRTYDLRKPITREDLALDSKNEVIKAFKPVPTDTSLKKPASFLNMFGF